MISLKKIIDRLLKPSAINKPADYAFVSYARKDETIVKQFSFYLQKEEIPPWIDNHLEFGETWENVIIDKIQRCKVFLVIMTANSRASEFVTKEINLALKEKKLIIPVLQSGEPFEELSNFHYVNLKDFWYTNIEFVERLRNILTPAQIPGKALQQQRVEYFLLLLFEVILGVGEGPRVFIGIGFDITFDLTPEESLAELDELDWAEIFMELKRQFPLQQFNFRIGTDYSAQFPTIRALLEFLLARLSWQEIQKINIKYKRGSVG